MGRNWGGANVGTGPAGGRIWQISRHLELYYGR